MVKGLSTGFTICLVVSWICEDVRQTVDRCVIRHSVISIEEGSFNYFFLLPDFPFFV